MANEDRITESDSELSREGYSKGFVDYYRQFLGLPTLEEQTGIETTDPEKITELRQPSAGPSSGAGGERDDSMDIGSFGFKGPEVNTNLSSFTSPHATYSDALNAAGLQDRVPFVENIVDPIMSGNFSAIEFGKQAGVVVDQNVDAAKGFFGVSSFEDVKEKVAEKAPTAMAGVMTAMNPLMGIGLGGVLTGKGFVNAFGQPSMRPGGILGAVTDVVATMQYNDMAAINAAVASGATQTGFAGLFGNLGITRAPGSSTYTGNMQDMTHQQVKNIEALSKGILPSTYNMVEETGTTMDEAGYTGLSSGGYYSQSGTYMDPYGRTSAMGLMKDLEALAEDNGISVSQASNALSKSRKEGGNLKENIAIEKGITQGSKDVASDYGDESVDTATYSGDPREESSFSGGFSFGGGGGDGGPGSSGAAGGSSPGGPGSAPDGYGGGSMGGLAQGGRVGLAMGGAPQMASGFVDRPPSQVSDGQSVADNVDTSLPEGAFVINAAAVEFAGESDIKKMLTDANKEAVRRGLTLDKQGNDAKLIDVAISRGEVVVSPHLAKIIGYDRLNKINNRGKPETQERIAENGQQSRGAAGGGFIDQEGPVEDVGDYESMRMDVPPETMDLFKAFASKKNPKRADVERLIDSLDEKGAMALTILTETIASKDPLESMQAVGQVILNRASTNDPDFDDVNDIKAVLKQRSSRGSGSKMFQFDGLEPTSVKKRLREVVSGRAPDALDKVFAAAENVLSGQDPDAEYIPSIPDTVLYYTKPGAAGAGFFTDNPLLEEFNTIGGHNFYTKYRTPEFP